MTVQRILLRGEWVNSQGTETFQAVNPSTGRPLDAAYPVSPWSEIDAAVTAAAEAFDAVQGWPGERFADFLDSYAAAVESRAEALVQFAHEETALPEQPRLKDVELPRTVNQLRQAARAARDGSWALPTIDSQANIRSMLEPIGPVAVFGPNNFPFAFNSIAGGDFAAAVAAGNPVIAKGHTSHPGTTRLFADAALQALQETRFPPGFVQLLYRTSHEDGCRLVSHPRMGATGYTGSRSAGLTLKEAADRHGKPIYLELSSINPVFVLNGVLAERLESLAEEFTASCLMGTGQFCTNPGLVILQAGDQAEAFVAAVASRFQNAAVGTFLSEGVQRGFAESLRQLQAAGAEMMAGDGSKTEERFCHPNTLLKVDGRSFLQNPEALQAEAFGNGSLLVIGRDADELVQIAGVLEGNLTGCIYSATDGSDDPLADRVAAVLRRRVGRLLNDKMPTGVAVSPAMNHGGPYPATGHPGFTAVGIPAALRRFAMLSCYDNVRPHRLPPLLRNAAPNAGTWRWIDGDWTQGAVNA